jgi:hypothetical protein
MAAGSSPYVAITMYGSPRKINSPTDTYFCPAPIHEITDTPCDHQENFILIAVNV